LKIKRIAPLAWVLVSLLACAAAATSQAQDRLTETRMHVSKASGLRPLEARPRAGDELRIWILTHAVVGKFIVLRKEPAGTRGELRLWWGTVPGSAFAPAEGEQRSANARNRKWIRSLWGCSEHRIESLLEVCRVSFPEAPDWSQLLRQLEQETVWDLADGSTLKPAANLADGATLVVEVRRGGDTRTYTYTNPQSLPGPGAQHAERIRSSLEDFVRALEVKKGIYR
jgi:hypothetical protein